MPLISDSDRRVPEDWGQESQASSWVEAWNSACLSPLLCLEGVPDLPVAPQDEAGLTKTFQTWPRGWFHIP